MFAFFVVFLFAVHQHIKTWAVQVLDCHYCLGLAGCPPALSTRNSRITENNECGFGFWAGRGGLGSACKQNNPRRLSEPRSHCSDGWFKCCSEWVLTLTHSITHCILYTLGIWNRSTFMSFLRCFRAVPKSDRLQAFRVCF